MKNEMEKCVDTCKILDRENNSLHKEIQKYKDKINELIIESDNYSMEK